MTQRSQATADSGRAGGLTALLPLAMVFAAIAFLAVGAGRSGPDGKPARAAQPLAPSQSVETAEAEKAAAHAVVAISLARVAPPLPEEALAPPQPKAPAASKAAPQHAAEPVKGGRSVARREGPAGPQPQGAQAQAVPSTGRPMQPDKAQAGEPAPAAGVAPKENTKDEGVLARIGSYAPSPSRIAGAVSDGVSKLASYIPGL
ncbi:MAG: hypothetical protein ACK4MV_11825 [Beijerinckiaceae bacterium]